VLTVSKCVDFPDEVKTQPLSEFPSSLYRASGRDMTDSETECWTESDEMDSDSGYGIGGHRVSCHCSAPCHSSLVATERRQLPVYIDDCTSLPLSPTDQFVLVPACQWPSTSVSCSSSTTVHQVVDTTQRPASTSTATSMPRHRDVTHTANVGINTVDTAVQPTHHGVRSAGFCTCTCT